MKLTDKKAIMALKRANIGELCDMVADYPDDEVDGRSDWEMIANEAGYLLDSFNSFDTVRNEDLREAKEIIYRFRSGRMLYWSNGRPMWDQLDLETAKNTVNEYNRLKSFVARLKKMGLYCPYC